MALRLGVCWDEWDTEVSKSKTLLCYWESHSPIHLSQGSNTLQNTSENILQVLTKC